jgi:WD40 repeat protein
VADVFISYAREDREFARRLVDALTQRGRESWIDWKDIEPSEEWWRAITEASDAANAIIFICSPDSLASEVCQRELAYAAGQHKRLIPVVAREIEGLPAPVELAQLNYVFLRDQDDWDEGIAKLIRALDLDLELVRVQTRVLTRAEAWRLSGRRTTPLLRGDELRAAERWVAHAAAGGEPQPTDLQTEFISASRHVVSRRQRQAIIGSLIVAAVAIALAIFAFIQRSEARHQAKLAESRQDAASAEASLSTDPEGSISLAAAGLRIQSTPQAIHALWSALTASRLRAVLQGPSPVVAVAFSPSGSELAVGSANGTVRLWDVSDRRVLWSESGDGSAAGSLAFSSAGNLLAVGSNGNPVGHEGCSVELVNPTSGVRERTLGQPGSGPCFRYVSFVGSSGVVAVGGAGTSVQFWDAGSGQQAASPLTVVPPEAIMGALAISPDGRYLAVAVTNPNEVRIVNLRTGAQVAQFQNSTQGFLINPNSLVFSPDSSALLVAGEYATEIYSIEQRQAYELYAQDSGTQGAAWAADGRIVAAGGLQGAYVWSTSLRPVEILPGGSEQRIVAVAMTRSGLLAGGSEDGSVRIWAADPDLPDQAVTVPFSIALNYAGVASDADLTAFGNTQPQDLETGSPGVVVVDDTGREVRSIPVRGDGPFAVTASGELAFTRTGTLYFWQLRTGRQLRSIKLSSSAAVTAISTSANGATTALFRDFNSSAPNTLTVVSPLGQRTIKFSDDANVLSISRDGRLLAVPVSSGIEILSTSTLQVVRREAGIAVAYSPTGKLIAIQRPDLTIALIRTSDWKTVETAQGESTQAVFLSVSPDDQLLAALGDDGVVRVWDTNDGALISTRQIVEIAAQAQRVGPPPMVLVPGGYVIGGTPSNDIVSYDVCNQCLNASALLAQAHARLNEIAPVTATR